MDVIKVHDVAMSVLGRLNAPGVLTMDTVRDCQERLHDVHPPVPPGTVDVSTLGWNTDALVTWRATAGLLHVYINTMIHKPQKEGAAPDFNLYNNGNPSCSFTAKIHAYDMSRLANSMDTILDKETDECDKARMLGILLFGFTFSCFAHTASRTPAERLTDVQRAMQEVLFDKNDTAGFRHAMEAYANVRAKYD